MSQLVAYYDEEPVEVDNKVEIRQDHISAVGAARSVEGAVRTHLVYVVVHRPAETLLVPFGEYDDWSLRDRYNEAIRIMNVLGASTIVCETFREVSQAGGLRARINGKGGGLQQQRDENSGFDFRHEGSGNAPRDPNPLNWPDEPGFAAAVMSVLENGSAEVELNIKSSRNYSVNGSLGVQLGGLGFDLGGMMQKSGATSLHIHATFPQARKGWK
ncbi:hypothetical protein BDK89_0137 [Ilumatobacter fluminis]|uniref:Uncharacterized protein n=1 Tax=Ilumatobacter fluminis TaxID=467091 RepID=A0A4R7HUI5_9ACTN|nr:hypothetical protein [Ilumatobacter fluminis]TDT14582.1 hypothetical protein BDK89_0137 [Ilumatobacter fluminis]